MMKYFELKHCPFCGGKAKLTDLTQAPESWVECTECGARTRFFANDEEAAVSSWNARQVEVKMRAENKLLREALSECCCEYKKDGVPRCYARRDDAEGNCMAAKEGCLIYKVLKGEKNRD